MPSISGENSVPLGRSNTGAAYILANNNPNALAILENGRRAREMQAKAAADAKAKADALRAKEYNDNVKFDMDGSVYFGEGLQQQVYAPLTGQLTDIYKQRDLDSMGRSTATRPILQRANNETVQSKAKTQFLNAQMRAYQQDKEYYDPQYAGENLSSALHDGTRNRLPSEFDEEQWNTTLQADHRLYREPEVIKRTMKGLMPVISQKVSEAGAIGGQHHADTVRGRLVAFDGQGKPILNADGSPKLNLNGDGLALIDQGIFKLKADARQAAYEQAREADPNLPRMTRAGIVAQMVGPLAHYDTAHDEGLNPLPPRPRAAAKGEGSSVSAFNEADVAPTEVGAHVLGAPEDFKQALGLDFARPQYDNFFAPRKAGAPTIPQKNGIRKPVQADALYSREVAQEDGSGNLVVTRNNKKPMSGTYGEAYQLPVNPKTGEVAFPKDKEDEQRLLREGYVPQTYIAFDTDKNENFAGDSKRILAGLIAANDKKDEKTPLPELEAKARSMASKGVSRKFIPYNAENAATVNNQAGRYYADFHQGTIKARKAAVVPAAPKSLGIDFGAPKTPASAPNEAFKRAGTKKTGISF